jgi:LysM repeat protein
MFRNHFTLFLLLCLGIETATAKSIIDCRVVTGNITECNPYGAKFLRAKEVMYDESRQKLVRVKTLPTPEKKPFLKVVSVEDMIEKYVKVQESVRFKGTEIFPISSTEDRVPFTKVTPDEKTQADKISPLTEKEFLEEGKINYGEYIVARGDALSKIAKKFGLKTKKLAKINGLKIKDPLLVGQKLTLPFEQKMINALASATYRVEAGDTLISIAKKFNLDPKAVVEFNGIKSNTAIRTGNIVKLPLPYVLAKKQKAEAKKKKLAAQQKSGKVDLLSFGKNQLRVTATAYSSHTGQTDSTPFLAAWNNRLRPGMKIIAVSRDMLTKYGMRNGTKVRIGGLPGYYRVRDKMNKRYKKRIDIYTGVDRKKALRWGRRSVVIYW